MIYLVTGGSGSGKSAYAEELVEALSTEEEMFQNKSRYYIATMKPYGAETEKKIERHRKMRKEKQFSTVECYTSLEKANVPKDCIVLLECMSNLVANELFEPDGAKENTVAAILSAVDKLSSHVKALVIVTNEVFSDGLDYGMEMECYLSCLGKINQELAKRASKVVEVVYSIPIYIKGER